MQSRCHVVICKSKGSCRLLPVVFSLGSPKAPEDEECLVWSLSWLSFSRLTPCSQWARRKRRKGSDHFPPTWLMFVWLLCLSSSILPSYPGWFGCKTKLKGGGKGVKPNNLNKSDKLCMFPLPLSKNEVCVHTPVCNWIILRYKGLWALSLPTPAMSSSSPIKSSLIVWQE